MPELILRVRRGDGEPVDVIASVDESHTVADLASVVAARLGCAGTPVLRVVRTGRDLDPATPLGRAGLLAGDELLLPPHPTRGVATEAPGVVDAAVDPTFDMAIDILTGPDAGRSQLVRRPGRYVVGRSHDSTVRLDDPSVSRHHLAIELPADGGAVLHPRAATANGVLVDGVEISGPAEVGPTDVVTLGGTRLAIRAIPRRVASGATGFGRIDFHRTPYRPPFVPVTSVEPFGPVPERPDRRRLPAIAMLAPLLAGVAMFALSRQAQFLVLTLLSPIVMVGTAIDERRSGRRAARERVSRFRRELDEHRRLLVHLRTAERVARFLAAPDLADLGRRAELRTIDLWARGRGAPDVLRLRLGLGPGTVGHETGLQPGGADDLREEAARELAGLGDLVDVPVTVELDEVFAIHGDRALVDGAVCSLLVQAATLHSPDDVVVAAVSDRLALAWLRWLPHARSVASPVPGDHLAGGRAAGELLERLLDVAERRAERVAPAASTESCWPRVLVVLDAAAGLDAARVARLLDLAPSVGVAVVWLAGSAAEVPRQATRTLVVHRTASGVARGRLWSIRPDECEVGLDVETLRTDVADRVARALAPVRDASTRSLASSIPRTVPLLDVLGVGRPTVAWVVEQWTNRPLGGLRFAIGQGAGGPVELDLVEDGPHALVGGTSGAGKSELLQSMVASLAVRHPPTRLSFLFVDYKGGAASHVFERLPHTVGHVTNLSADLAARALTSLRAELHRRMALLEGRAKDLAELLAIDPDDAPPSLVIVVDEFATLVREVPEFVTGIVDIAQRGRSLGIHLVLATQRPTGAVNDNILANTNLRISLRMLDRAESTAVIGSPDAADIPVPLRGRGIVRSGPRQLVEFQTAFAGAPLLADAVRPPVLVRPFDTTNTTVRNAPAADVVGGSQLDAVLDAIRGAHDRLGLAAPPRPWRDVLPSSVSLDDVLADPTVAHDGASSGCSVAFGLLDAPERQEQRPAILSLDDGAVLVYGAGGAGASTLLRTVAAAVAPAAATIVALDAIGRGLDGVDALPGATVVPLDDLEAVSRWLVVLERELEQRRAGPTRVAGDVDRSPVVLLVDGIGELIAALADSSTAGDDWVERLVRLVVDGRQMGVHTVATAGRRAGVPARIQAAAAHRIVLRVVDDAAAADHGVAPARVRGLPPGRGWWSGPAHADPVLVQIASISNDPSPAAQRDALVRLGARLGSNVAGARTRALSSAPLVERDVAPLAAPGGLAVAIGRADLTGAPVVVDLAWSHLAVYGPPRSGRSTALATVASQLVSGDGGLDVVVAGPASSGLRDVELPAPVTTAFGGDLAPALEVLARSVERRCVLVLDDLDALDGAALFPVFERLARNEAIRLVAASDLHVGFSADPLTAVLRRARRQLVLRPDDPAEFLQLTGTRLGRRPGLRMPAGRGVLLVDRAPTVVQVTQVQMAGTPTRVAAATGVA